MNPETIQFQCGFCSTTLTVPAQMAGVSGPCPNCGNTVTSPMPAPVHAPAMAAPIATPAPQWPLAPPSPAPAHAANQGWSPPPNPMAAEIPSSYNEPQQPMPAAPAGGTPGGLPPRRMPGQAPLAAAPPAAGGAPAWAAAPPMGGAAPQSGLPQGQGPAINHSRLIPGAPALPGAQSPNAGGFGGQFGSPPGSLLGRDVAPAPMSPMTQQLQPLSPPAGLSLGGTLPPNPSTGSHGTLPAGRKMANLREPRGTGFLRLAFAALFLLSFLGIVGYFLKDYLPPSIMSLLHRDDAEESTVAKGTAPVIPSAMPQPPVIPVPPTGKDTDAPVAETVTRPIGFDPLESAPKSDLAAGGESAGPQSTGDASGRWKQADKPAPQER